MQELQQMVEEGADNRGTRIMAGLMAYHPNKVSRGELMIRADIHATREGPVSAVASFQWWVAVLNTGLQIHGWQIVRSSSELYWLEKRRSESWRR